LGFQEQLRLSQDSLPDDSSRGSPGGIQLARFAAGEPMRGPRFGQAWAIFGMGARHRHQILHGHLGADGAAAHLLLHAFRQQFHQRQSARYPAPTAIKPPRQLVESVAEALLQVHQQPALFQRCRSFPHAQRTVQHQRLGLAQRPHQRLYRVPPQLLQGRNALVAVDY
jgi:hypothetical protein